MAIRENFTYTDMDSWLDEKRVTEIECLMPDLTGVARGKILPRGKFTQERGMRIPEAVLGMTEQLEPTPLTVGSAYDLKFELPQGLPEALQALRAEYKLRSGALHRRVCGDQGP